MSNLAILHKCGRCGKVAGKPFDLALQGKVVESGFACDDCMDETMANLDRVRPVFEAMLAADVPREIASDTMTFMLDRMAP